MLVVASKGGSDTAPAWYRNLTRPIPRSRCRSGRALPARARDATPERSRSLWRTMAADWPAYDDYQEQTEREIPVVVLEPA